MSVHPTVRRCGEHAILLEVAEIGQVLALADQIRTAVAAVTPGFADIVDVVPAARTVLVVLDEERGCGALENLCRVLDDLDADERGDNPEARGKSIRIPVHYDGPDLSEIAELTGLSTREVIQAHQARSWRAAFGGFAPGFAYLIGGDERLTVPRRSEPRTSVPAGAVGLAGEFSAVYPGPSPGGWQLLGHTDVAVWDPNREPAALVPPGSLVWFVDADETSAGSETDGEDPAADGSNEPDSIEADSAKAGADLGDRPMTGQESALEVIATGPLALVQDRGRPGLAGIGVSRSGAADRRSFGLGARLLAQDGRSAAIEVTFGGLSVRAHGKVLAVLTGAVAPARVRAGEGREWRVGYDGPFALADGEVLTLQTPAAGLRTYLSVRGGIDARPELGSRSTDTLSGLGPRPLRAGDLLPIGPPPPDYPDVDLAPTRALLLDTLAVRAIIGPRDDWLADPLDLFGPTWTVSENSDRVGIRLAGGKVRHHPSARGSELPSEGVVRGSIQIPAGGEPVVFLADHPVTGGYPVVAVIVSHDVDQLAQAVPGQSVRMTVSD